MRSSHIVMVDMVKHMAHVRQAVDTCHMCNIQPGAK